HVGEPAVCDQLVLVAYTDGEVGLDHGHVLVERVVGRVRVTGHHGVAGQVGWVGGARRHVDRGVELCRLVRSQPRLRQGAGNAGAVVRAIPGAGRIQVGDADAGGQLRVECDRLRAVVG